MRSFLIGIIDVFKGWYEIASAPVVNYKYLITDVNIYQELNKLEINIVYKTVGVRKASTESVSQLNNSDVFSKFRYDHAQIIVTLATIEALMFYSQDELKIKIFNYLNHVKKNINKPLRIK